MDLELKGNWTVRPDRCFGVYVGSVSGLVPLLSISLLRTVPLLLGTSDYPLLLEPQGTPLVATRGPPSPPGEDPWLYLRYPPYHPENIHPWVANQVLTPKTSPGMWPKIPPTQLVSCRGPLLGRGNDGRYCVHRISEEQIDRPTKFTVVSWLSCLEFLYSIQVIGSDFSLLLARALAGNVPAVVMYGLNAAIYAVYHRPYPTKEVLPSEVWVEGYAVRKSLCSVDNRTTKVHERLTPSNLIETRIRDGWYQMACVLLLIDSKRLCRLCLLAPAYGGLPTLSSVSFAETCLGLSSIVKGFRSRGICTIFIGPHMILEQTTAPMTKNA
ncbi:hypothetical protein An09g05750 [Aspergillus niger]|uniref:Uncharacterized protein n=2 Tax=Aspergillus niger TaxID=5061 RepID=A2QUI4_ASPNC|nr:hypothetical protein An09g05750 [Aspergillus niger]CAL00853.1 hypothetical protein An09g05750 [Aspergillus niger]